MFFLAMVCIVAGAAEAIAYAAYLLLHDGYFAPDPTREEFGAKLDQQYRAENFDAALGWIPLKSDREADGSRVSPDNPKSGRTCVSLYGDSFVFGDEVGHSAAWPNQLAKRLNCKVLNFGVSGYGTDQAYLRFDKNFFDHSSVVMLGILSENIVRNVNQNRAFLYSSGVGPLKPMFWLDDTNRLQLIPMPKLTEDSYDQYMTDPGALFVGEFFIPDSSYNAEQRVHFPYIIGVVNALLYKRIYYGLAYYLTSGLPWYQEFYDPSHPSHALQTTARIMDQFVDRAVDRGKTPIVVFLPTSRDVEGFLRTGEWVYDNLYKLCQGQGYNCFDAGNAVVAKLGARRIDEGGICEFFCTNRLTKQGHYTEKGNALLADVTSEYLRGYLSTATAADSVGP